MIEFPLESKEYPINNIDKIKCIRENILKDINKITESLHSDNSLELLCKLKFQRTIKETTFGENLNFIEYLNQVFTYLVCLCAGEILLKEFQEPITINFGTSNGYDVSTDSGKAIGECFAVTSAKSNNKLDKDAKRLADDPNATYKIVVFYSENAEKEKAKNENAKNKNSFYENIEKKYDGVQLKSLSFDELINGVKPS